MQRVDQDELRALLGAPRGEPGQVAEVAEAPGVAGADRVELGHQPPDLARQRGGQLEPLGGDDEQPLLDPVAAACAERVVAGGQVGGQREPRLAGEHAVDLAGRDVVRQLGRGDRPRRPR